MSQRRNSADLPLMPRIAQSRADEAVTALPQPVSSCAPWGRRPSTAIAAARLIPATTTGVSALSQPAGMSRCLTSRSARYPAVIAAPRPPSARSAEASRRRTRAAIAHVCAASITTGADSAVPITRNRGRLQMAAPARTGRRRRGGGVSPMPFRPAPRRAGLRTPRPASGFLPWCASLTGHRRWRTI